jgi:hypothetical protein
MRLKMIVNALMAFSTNQMKITRNLPAQSLIGAVMELKPFARLTDFAYGLAITGYARNPGSLY